MDQIILSPNDKAATKDKPSRPLSKEEQELKKIIDISDLLPGDLLLTSEINPGFIARNIRATQKHGGYMAEHARWEHAAIYIGKNVLCEATRNGVCRQMLSHYVGKHNLRFRRDLGLTTEQRYELVIEALSCQGYAYGFREIIRLLRVARNGFANTTKNSVNYRKPSTPQTICSQLYIDCYNQATPGKIEDKMESTPAKLSLLQSFVDVKVNWIDVDS